ncbi:MAG TPA: hypothetical protein VIA18_20135, partial [Polyangia bacterium]|nr:hypothetical protein [Polyangia bacterium]
MLVLLYAGCYAPDYGNGALQCAAGGVCPSGLHCASDNRCYTANSGPDLAVSLDMSEPTTTDMAQPSAVDSGTSPDMTVPPKSQGQVCGVGDV